MGILEQVMQMQKEGASEEQIISNLREQGISPKEINDALGQSQIKGAISNSEGMEKSLMPSQEAQAQIPVPTSINGKPKGGFYTPKTHEAPQEEYYQEPSQEQYPQNFYQPEEAAQYNYAASDFSADTIIEVSEQVFSEKIKKFQKQFSELKEFKILTESKLDNAVERLKKVENTIDKLQMAILDKIGSYGHNLESIKKEMSMIEDSFSQVVSKTHHSHTAQQPPHKHTSHKKKSHKKK